MSRTPEILWAQRSDKVYLTVSLPEAKDIVVKCEPEGLFKFSATGPQEEKYEFTLDLYGAIAPEGCKAKTGWRNILCSIQKEQRGWWKRLLKSEEKTPPYLKVDWNKWRDEDDEESDCIDLHVRSTCSAELAYNDDTAADNDGESSDDDGLLYLPDLEKARGL
ncbi:uncharacterized protein At3g03773-like isoform X1 [Chenopodium quinoa]|uniref:uncharacterized protein At3g03773-like isoform X1 n=1 Tax=Chenopodium quinoa TaxID=63459 RepID=UPI000B782E1E|nr:uncharacterized protein At3g03773-like isoform X1 [Chenopodium quinoa]